MAIVYDWYENPGATEDSEERALHPRLFLNGKVSTADLCERIHERSSLSVGDVKSAFDTLAQLCAEELREGREIHIEGLGYFAPTLKSTETVTRSTSHKSGKLALKTVSFRPDARLKSRLAGIKAVRSGNTRHSASCSAEMIDTRLTAFFAEHDMMFRSDFQELFGMTRTTANRHLRRLVEGGKLVNIGQRFHPVYVLGKSKVEK